MASKVNIVPHMHWDREWYFSTQESEILLMNNMEEILDYLEKNEDYPVYVLDGQTAILEDYLSLVPENKDRIKKLVQKGRLIIGPWYTQTDEMVVGAESIVRNLLYGHKDCEEFGKPMDIGYLPDSFGQSGSMPMILNGFDINRAMFWRGTSERMGTDKTEFYWTSDDGSQVLAQLLPLGYAIGKYLPTEYQDLKMRCDRYVPVLDKGATGENILLPNGHDQMPIQKNIKEVIEQLKIIYPDKDFFLSSYDHLFKELEKKDDYDTIHGELLDGKYMRVHRSIYSSRSDIKIFNTIVENKITNLLEPLASIAYSLGFTYYHGEIESIWKLILKNHAHDSMGCCCSDKVHNEIYQRFVIANEKVDQLIRYYTRKITDAMSCEKSLDKLSVFNLLPYSRKKVIRGEIITRMKAFDLYDVNNEKVEFECLSKEIVDAGLIDRQIVHYGNYDPFFKYTVEFISELPPMGYKTFFVKNKKEITEIIINSTNCLENDFYTIMINKNGTLTIKDKNSDKIYTDVLLLEDLCDDGDSYDYSPLQNDKPTFSNDVKANISIYRNSFSSYAEISYRFELPKDIESRKKGLKDSYVDVNIKVKLEELSRNIELHFEVNNQAKDHRLRVYIPDNISGKNSISDNQFGMITRPVYDSAMDVWEKEGWSERPDSIYPFLSYVAIENGSIAALSNSIREFEIVGSDNNVIALTLFRSIGYLGKEDLLRRPGRPSGIKLEIPDSQLLKTMKMDLALTFYDDSSQLSRIAKEYTTPIVTYNKMPYNAMKMNDVDFNVPYSYSLFEEQNNNVTLSVLKKSEKEDCFIYRVYNTQTESQEIKLNNIQILSQVNLNEKKISGNSQILHNQVKGYRLKK